MAHQLHAAREDGDVGRRAVRGQREPWRAAGALARVQHTQHTGPHGRQGTRQVHANLRVGCVHGGVSVCVCVCVRACPCTYVYIRVGAPVCVCVYVWCVAVLHVCGHVTCECVSVHAHLSVHAHACVSVLVCA